MARNLEISYADCLELSIPEQLTDFENRMFEVNPSKLVSDLFGLIKPDREKLYIISRDFFYSVGCGLKDLTAITKHGKVPADCKDFLVISGKVYLMYSRFLLVYSLFNFAQVGKVSCASNILSIISLGADVFISTESLVLKVTDDKFLFNYYSVDWNRILDIRASYLEMNSILIILDKEYVIINKDLAEVFRFFHNNPCSVDFLNDDVLVFYDMSERVLFFIEWMESNDIIKTIDLKTYDLLSMKVKENIVLLADNENGFVVLIMFDTERRVYYKIDGHVLSSFSEIEIDFIDNSLQNETIFDGTVYLNLFITRNDNLYHFSIKPDFSQGSCFIYTLVFPFRSLEHYENPEDSKVMINHSPLNPESIQVMKSPLLNNFETSQPLNSNDLKIAKIKELFSHKSLSSAFEKAFDRVTPISVRDPIDLDFFIDLSPLKKFQFNSR